jgi:hypothetical protein
MTENFDEFYNDFFQKQFDWYDNRALRNKWIYISLRVMVLILAVSIPVSVSFIPQVASTQYMINAITIMSLLLLILESILSLLNPHENWMNYRSTAEAMRREEQSFKTLTGDYEDATDPEALFVERINSLVSKEHRVWRVVTRKAKGN